MIRFLSAASDFSGIFEKLRSKIRKFSYNNASCEISGRSAVWLAHLVWDQGVEGSNPFAPTTFCVICCSV